MTEQQLKIILQLLENASRRPGMYFPLSKDGLNGFLGGIQAMKSSFFVDSIDIQLTHAILMARGWDMPNALGPFPAMEAQGYTVQQMIDEILAIEIAVCNAQLRSLESYRQER